MSSSAVIRASGLGKAYRIYERPVDRLLELLVPIRGRGTDFWALQDIDLTVQAGEAVGIIGRNGSGKSTLLQLVCGLLQPSTGDVVAGGRVAGLLELGAGFNPDFTGRENVNLTAAILGLRADEITARFDAIAAFAGLGAFMERPVYEYSSGMYARLAFAICAHVDADILVIDEILAVGDAAFQQKCMRYLRAFRAGGGTLLIVSHSEATILALCERAVWLDRGKLQADGPSGEVCRRYAAALQEGGRLQAGNRLEQTSTRVMQATLALRFNTASYDNFDFDPDVMSETDDVQIKSVGIFAPNGAQVKMAEIGERLELRIDCIAANDLDDVVLAFIVRDHLGRPIFSDDTNLIERVPNTRIKIGDPFSAKFVFYLPFLLTGEYSIEAFVFERSAQQCRLLVRAIDSYFFSVHSRHIGGGLANIPVIETVLEITEKA